MANTNKQRREAAQRKLQRQLERRAKAARKRKILTIAGACVAAAVVVGGISWLVVANRGNNAANEAASETSTPAAPTAEPMPTARAEALPATVACAYPAAGDAAREVKAPPTENVPTTPATEAITLETSQGPIGIQLDRALSPCTVNSFVSLADQGFFNDTTCHRLTTGDYLQVLQCGDPTGTGAGGPGYSFKNEFPTDQFDASDPNSFASRDYKRGVVAMANAGADTNGSQFFLVYGDSILPPNYTIFGTMTDEGLATVEKVAAAGANVEGTDAPDGTPNAEVKITSVKKD